MGAPLPRVTEVVSVVDQQRTGSQVAQTPGVLPEGWLPIAVYDVDDPGGDGQRVGVEAGARCGGEGRGGRRVGVF